MRSLLDNQAPSPGSSGMHASRAESFSLLELAPGMLVWINLSSKVVIANNDPCPSCERAQENGIEAHV